MSELTSIYLPEPATLLDVRMLTEKEKYFKIRFDEPRAATYMPGQFMEVSVPGIGECPISICSSPTRHLDGSFEMVIRDAGSTTHAMHQLTPGDKIGLRGPYGVGFPVDQTMRGRNVLVICGGIGLVPVRSAIHYVLDHRSEYGDLTVLFGARRPEERLFTGELYELEIRDDVVFHETVDVADPSWGGNVGLITTLIPLVRLDPAKTAVIVCGPPIMYRFVLYELRKLQFAHRDIYVSLERRMKCAVGKCGHCQINGLYACQDGPVFNYAEIAAVREAL